jgi:tRNA G18 (ribose-2'-O)-methylase SpoU
MAARDRPGGEAVLLALSNVLARFGDKQLQQHSAEGLTATAESLVELLVDDTIPREPIVVACLADEYHDSSLASSLAHWAAVRALWRGRPPGAAERSALFARAVASQRQFLAVPSYEASIVNSTVVAILADFAPGDAAPPELAESVFRALTAAASGDGDMSPSHPRQTNRDVCAGLASRMFRLLTPTGRLVAEAVRTALGSSHAARPLRKNWLEPLLSEGGEKFRCMVSEACIPGDETLSRGSLLEVAFAMLYARCEAQSWMWQIAEESITADVASTRRLAHAVLRLAAAGRDAVPANWAALFGLLEAFESRSSLLILEAVRMFLRLPGAGTDTLLLAIVRRFCQLENLCLRSTLLPSKATIERTRGGEEDSSVSMPSLVAELVEEAASDEGTVPEELVRLFTSIPTDSFVQLVCGCMVQSTVSTSLRSARALASCASSILRASPDGVDLFAAAVTSDAWIARWGDWSRSAYPTVFVVETLVETAAGARSIDGGAALAAMARAVDAVRSTQLRSEVPLSGRALLFLLWSALERLFSLCGGTREHEPVISDLLSRVPWSMLIDQDVGPTREAVMKAVAEAVADPAGIVREWLSSETDVANARRASHIAHLFVMSGTPLSELLVWMLETVTHLSSHPYASLNAPRRVLILTEAMSAVVRSCPPTSPSTYSAEDTHRVALACQALHEDGTIARVIATDPKTKAVDMRQESQARTASFWLTGFALRDMHGAPMSSESFLRLSETASGVLHRSVSSLATHLTWLLSHEDVLLLCKSGGRTPPSGFFSAWNEASNIAALRATAGAATRAFLARSPPDMSLWMECSSHCLSVSQSLFSGDTLPPKGSVAARNQAMASKLGECALVLATMCAEHSAPGPANVRGFLADALSCARVPLKAVGRYSFVATALQVVLAESAKGSECMDTFVSLADEAMSSCVDVVPVVCCGLASSCMDPVLDRTKSWTPVLVRMAQNDSHPAQRAALAAACLRAMTRSSSAAEWADVAAELLVHGASDADADVAVRAMDSSLVELTVKAAALGAGLRVREDEWPALTPPRAPHATAGFIVLSGIEHLALLSRSHETASVSLQRIVRCVIARLRASDSTSKRSFFCNTIRILQAICVAAPGLSDSELLKDALEAVVAAVILPAGSPGPLRELAIHLLHQAGVLFPVDTAQVCVRSLAEDADHSAASRVLLSSLTVCIVAMIVREQRGEDVTSLPSTRDLLTKLLPTMIQSSVGCSASSRTLSSQCLRLVGRSLSDALDPSAHPLGTALPCRPWPDHDSLLGKALGGEPLDDLSSAFVRVLREAPLLDHEELVISKTLALEVEAIDRAHSLSLSAVLGSSIPHLRADCVPPQVYKEIGDIVAQVFASSYEGHQELADIESSRETESAEVLRALANGEPLVPPDRELPCASSSVILQEKIQAGRDADDRTKSKPGEKRLRAPLESARPFMTPVEDPVAEFGSKTLTQFDLRTGRPSQPIVVVASLLTKDVNVGGLSRTCEIFSAEALIVPSRKTIVSWSYGLVGRAYVVWTQGSSSFKSLAMYSHEWLSTPVVPPSELSAFLQRMRLSGYTVVALEQTSSSVPIQEFRFPERCVLLLGAEKTGIPAPILQQCVDVAVEIPQTGETRSLNVHVSGAMCLFQYTQQRLGRA